MTKEQKAHVEAILIQRIDALAKDRFGEPDDAIARLTRELAEIHYVVCDEAEQGIKPPISIPIYDGLTPEETAAMLVDVAAAKEEKGYTPVFIGASGATYIGGVRLEAVRTMIGLSERGVHEVRIEFDTNKVKNNYRPKKEGGWSV